MAINLDQQDAIGESVLLLRRDFRFARERRWP